MPAKAVNKTYVLTCDKTAAHAVCILDAWLRGSPEDIWVRAEVERYEGLTLYSNDGVTELHFDTPKCGYEGNGPRTAWDMLEMAGFCKLDPDAVREELFTREYCEFTRTA